MRNSEWYFITNIKMEYENLKLFQRYFNQNEMNMKVEC